ncbi:MAG: hypothetical protein CL521_00735 [Actinobacteria bacterium]|nr:hypothetical protein [Actinomycetota bacterium]
MVIRKTEFVCAFAESKGVLTRVLAPERGINSSVFSRTPKGYKTIGAKITKSLQVINAAIGST